MLSHYSYFVCLRRCYLLERGKRLSMNSELPFSILCVVFTTDASVSNTSWIECHTLSDCHHILPLPPSALLQLESILPWHSDYPEHEDLGIGELLPLLTSMQKTLPSKIFFSSGKFHIFYFIILTLQSQIFYLLWMRLHVKIILSILSVSLFLFYHPQINS